MQEDHSVKNDHHHDKQHYKRKNYKYQFTQEQPRDKNTKTKH
jgi:hypothetical protein